MKKTTIFFIILASFLFSFAKKVKATEIECQLPTCFPIKIPTISCFSPCFPTCSPKPTPTEVILTPTGVQPTPTSGLPTPTAPFVPTLTPTSFSPSPWPTNPPSVGGQEGEPPSGGEPSGCNAQIPPAPYLKSVTKIKANEVELVWDPVEPTTHYSISYGPSAGNYLYGVVNTGKVTSFKVEALGAGNYCFVVRAINDCAPSGPSNELCVGGLEPKILGAKVLGATGGINDFIWKALFIIGMVCANLGVKICFSKKTKVFF